jgi:tRNA nucleotidyltransferase/poly(A) polymerase
VLPFDTNIFPFKTGVYLVGGSVRDLLAGRKPYDYDLAVGHNPSDFASGLAGTTGGHIAELGKQSQKMLRVVTKECFFDILPVNGSTIESDLRLRDFTINAMAVEVASGSLIDPLGGQQDLAAKTVRMVSPDVFRQDPVRLVRAYRMAAIFNFSIDRHTQSAIATDAGLIRKSAPERIREELFKILLCSDSHPYLTMMARSDLLFSIFPEFLKLEQQQLKPAGSGTLFDRTLESYNQLEILLNSENKIRRSFGNQSFPGDDADRSINIKWAILFHDLARFGVDPSPGEGQSDSPQARANESALMARRICRRLRFSRRHSDIIEMIIRHHVGPMIIFSARSTKSTLKKEFIRLFLNCNDVTPDVLLHALAEFRGRKKSNASQLSEFTEFIQMLIQKYATILRPRFALPPPINGHDLIQEFGLTPSAEFKLILQRLSEKRLSQPDFTREEALKLVSKLINQK